MSHGICKPFDKVIGPLSRNQQTGEVENDWHGLTEDVHAINDGTISPLLFKIEEKPIQVTIDGTTVEIENGKVLVANLRECRPDLIKIVNGAHDYADCYVPLHTPKQGYQVITNKDVWEAAKACIQDVEGATIERAFTLEKLTKFGVSIAIGERELTVRRFNGVVEKTKAQLNLITSHDGKYACQAYDSTTRIVCMNTLRWSLEAAGNVGFKVYHTKNATAAVKNFPDLVREILLGRANYVNQMEYFDSIEVNKDQALYLALCFLQTLKESAEVSTRNLNTAEEIQRLYALGKGNYGTTALDLLNGVTEYYTSGDGTGMRSDNATKAYKADYGKAADHKNAFVNFLMGLQGDNFANTVEIGRKFYVEAMQA